MAGVGPLGSLVAAIIKRKKEVPPIPAVPPDASPQQRQFMEKVKEALEVRLGQRGDELNQMVTRRDLVEAGLTQAWDGSRYVGGSRTLPPNPTLVPLTPHSDPYGDLTVPQPPRNAQIRCSASYNLLSWTPSGEFHVEHTEIWGALVDDVDQAILVGTGHKAFAHEITAWPGQVLYYWLRFISFSGVPSPWHALSGLASSPGALGDNALRSLIADEVFAASGTFIKMIVEDASISNAMIGDTIQSDNYVPGVSGWIIKK